MEGDAVKKLISVLLLLVLLISGLICCAPDPQEEQPTEAETEAPEQDIFGELAEPVLIADEKKQIFRLVRPDLTTEAVLDCYREINSVAEKLVGYQLSGSTDWMKVETDVSGQTEILIGNTNRPETQEIMNLIGYDDFAVVRYLNKIVIAAHNETRLVEAVRYFCSELLSADGKKLYFTANYRTQGDQKFVFNNENRLENYRIVYSASRPAAEQNAVLFRDKLKKSYGIELPLVKDSEPPVECEFIIGRADREIVRKNLNGVTVSEYVIAVEGKTILIGSNSDDFTSLAVKKFCDENVNRYYSNTINFTANYTKRDTTYSFAEPSELAEGSDIRVMSFNILCEKYNDKLPVEGRDYGVAACIRYFLPDVVGLQEVSDNWYANLDNLIGDEYVFTDRKNEKNQTNFSTLAYNKNKVRLTEHGTKIFSQGNNTQLRLVTWGLFEVLATGKKFIAMSTHWDLGSNPQYQQVHSDEMAEFCVEMGKKYAVPIVTTGDYNTNETSSYYANFLKKTGFRDAKTGSLAVKHTCTSYHSVGTAPKDTPGNAIDHIFGSLDLSFLFYTVVLDKAVVDASDHCPIFADVRLG